MPLLERCMKVLPCSDWLFILSFGKLKMQYWPHGDIFKTQAEFYQQCSKRGKPSIPTQLLWQQPWQPEPRLLSCHCSARGFYRQTGLEPMWTFMQRVCTQSIAHKTSNQAESLQINDGAIKVYQLLFPMSKHSRYSAQYINMALPCL